MIVPFAKGQSAQQAPAQAQPSETNMLMALATMHQMGRIPTGDEARPLEDRKGIEPKAYQAEHLLYPDGKDKEGNDETREGPLNLLPKPLTDPKAVGVSQQRSR
jgi:hypothetical protein